MSWSLLYRTPPSQAQTTAHQDQPLEGSLSDPSFLKGQQAQPSGSPPNEEEAEEVAHRLMSSNEGA